jgi:hypothetical protein
MNPRSLAAVAHNRRAAPLWAFCAVQAVLVSTALGFGIHRYEWVTSHRVLPTPRQQPLQIGPLYNRPDVVTDEQLVTVLNLLKPQLRGRQPKINHVDHALRFWGAEATFDDRECLSGAELRELLLDHRTFAAAWGPEAKPYLIPDTTRDGDSISFRTKAGAATASHYDHSLAGLAEVGTPLDYPVITPVGERPLSAALTYSLEHFSLNQEEYEWSALALLHYCPDTPRWFTTEGQEITWDRLADRLMRQRLAQGVCYGNHRLYTLVMLLRVDAERQRLLSDAVRQRMISHLQDATSRLVLNQHSDGYWDGRWPGDEADGPQPESVEGPFGRDADRLLATGHTLEWWALAPSEVQPPRETVSRAGQWLCRRIPELSPGEVKSYYPFLTHAGRALALWRAKLPHEVPLPPASDTPAPVEPAVRSSHEAAETSTDGEPS